ncbi:MAG: hypothetical protein FWC68_00405 [Oscillospiraceae bacterium]|nr:hypothetical protein [Oscillospiraceae bacterium]
MENAADGLKMAFAIMMFVFSASIAFMGISQAVEVSDIVSRAVDVTEFYPDHRYVVNDPINPVPPGQIRVVRRDDNALIMYITAVERNRIVGEDVVIASLYRYNIENFAVIIRDGMGGNAANPQVIARFDADAEPYNPPWSTMPGGDRLRVDSFLGGQNASINPANPGAFNIIFGGASGHSAANPTQFFNAIRSFSNLRGTRSGLRFEEDFVEILVRGEIEIAPDGSERVTTPPVRKIFLIYTAID